MNTAAHDRRAEPGMRDALALVLSQWTERRAPDRELPITPSPLQLVVAGLLALGTGLSIYAGLVMLISRVKAP